MSGLVLASQERQGSAVDASASMTTMPSSASPCNGSARTPSPATARLNGARAAKVTAAAATASSSSPPLQAPRPRHHMRSFSTERRFVWDEDSRPNGTHTSHIGPTSSSSLSIPQSGMFSAPPTRAKRSPSLESITATAASTSPAQTPPALHIDQGPSSASSSLPEQGSSTAPARRAADTDSFLDQSNGSMASTLTSGERGSTSADEREQIKKLRVAQASRRPRVQRLTPAFSSLPSRIPMRKEESQQEADDTAGSSSQVKHGNSLQFPPVESENAGEAEPGAGLQIDLACIPAPSLADLHGPISTSHVERLVRDRHGNPVKSSLKNTRSGVVSQMLPGRTTRSDSTPSIPMHLSKSVPTTPTIAKNVKFDTHLEHVKLFKNRQRPTAVSRDGSPEQTETETEEEKEMYPYVWSRNSNSGSSASPPSADTQMNAPARAKSPTPGEEQLVLRLPNFPSSTRLSTSRPVFLERIFLAEDLRSVKGTVQVRNMSFEKWVAIRYTLDHWATIGEVSADYAESIKGGQADRFSFSIKLNELLNWPRGSSVHETKSMFICVRFKTNGLEYWDNNDNLNYQLDFRRRPTPTTPASTPMTTVTAVRAAAASTAIANSGSGVARSRVLEMARQGVGGKGVFAMDELRRELEKLRSDEEDDESRTRLSLLASDARARHRALTSVSGSDAATASPPKSPDARSSSPSMWSARYDFARSLRDSGKGSKTGGDSRTTGLDYFSSRPVGRNHSRTHSPELHKQAVHSSGFRGESPSMSRSASQSPRPSEIQPSTALSNNPESGISTAPPAFTVSAASPPMRHQEFAEMPTYHGHRASAFNARFGMFSPGIDQTVHHMPSYPESGTPSASNSPSPGVTPTLGSSGLPPSSTSSSTSVSPEHSYPLSSDRQSGRHALYVPASSEALHSRTSSSVSSSAASSPISPQREPLSSSNMSKHDGERIETSAQTSPLKNIRMVAGSSEDSSPPSEQGSPNPFSPSVSISSMESDTTVSNSDTKSTKSGNGLGAGRDFSAARPRHAVTASGHSQPLRPASMSDYNEIVSRFCWNADLVPSGGSMLPDMPKHGGLGKASVHIDGTPKVPPSLAPAIETLPPYMASSTVAKTRLGPDHRSSRLTKVEFGQQWPREQHSPPGGSGSGSANGSGASTPTF